MTDSAVNWEDPPDTASRPGKRSGGKFGVLAAQLRANPGKTAIIKNFRSPEAARNFAGQVERGRRKGFGLLDAKGGETEAPGGFEAYSEPKGTDVWVQFVGTPAAADD